MTALARRRDPASSHAAAEQMNLTGMTKYQRDLVLRLVLAYPGMTSLELSRLPVSPLDRYQIARRAAELAEDGEIQKGAIRKDQETGRASETLWPAKDNVTGASAPKDQANG